MSSVCESPSPQKNHSTDRFQAHPHCLSQSDLSIFHNNKSKGVLETLRLLESLKEQNIEHKESKRERAEEREQKRESRRKRAKERERKWESIKSKAKGLQRGLQDLFKEQGGIRAMPCGGLLYQQ